MDPAKLKKRLKDKFSDSKSVGVDFVNSIEEFFSVEKNIKYCLVPTISASSITESFSSSSSSSSSPSSSSSWHSGRVSQESLVRILLKEDHFQKETINILLSKLQEFIGDDLRFV